MKRRIAFFDFDGTITTKDTLLEVIKYSKGPLRFYIGFLLNAPFLVAYKLKLISNQTAKQRVLKYFFGKTPVDAFQVMCDAFAANELPALIRPKALVEIKKLQDMGAEVVIVSASAENWIQSWTKAVGVQLISTQLETLHNLITGRIKGANCHGQEKVRRITTAYSLPGYDEIYCYGDTKGDKPMLGLATFAFFKPFR